MLQASAFRHGLFHGQVDNPRMIDVGREVVVRFEGKEIHRGVPVPDFWTVFETLDARLDRSMVFDRRIEL